MLGTRRARLHSTGFRRLHQENDGGGASGLRRGTRLKRHTNSLTTTGPSIGLPGSSLARRRGGWVPLGSPAMPCHAAGRQSPEGV